jgi:hypothetical protein
MIALAPEDPESIVQAIRNAGHRAMIVQLEPHKEPR